MAKVEKVITLQIYDGLKELLSAKTNYRENMLDLISYLERFDKINREEFAYLLFVEQQGTGVDFNTMSSVIQDYRNQLLEIEVSVDVRNDIKIREDTKKDRRKEPIGFLSAFHYFTSLLSQAGLLEKEDKGNYYKCIKNRKNDLIKLR
ncbi:MAG: hypothetical protein GX306_08490 [Clostridiales bacterium]|nr:hypothetical protein [Clostridiales bacterium]